MIPNKFVVLWDNSPTGVDRDSCGYPYKTDNANQIKYWDSREEAEKYIGVFTKTDSQERYSHMRVTEIQFKMVW